MMYGAPVWYTGKRDKGLVQRLQIAQNEGIRVISGTFRTSPLEPLHNLTRVPPISYTLSKLMLAYSRRLGTLPPKALVRSLIEFDRCRIWPDFINPETNLTCALQGIEVYTYRYIDPCKTGQWTHPRLIYVPLSPQLPYSPTILRHDTHIHILPTARNSVPIAVVIVQRDNHTIHRDAR